MQLNNNNTLLNNGTILSPHKLSKPSFYYNKDQNVFGHKHWWEETLESCHLYNVKLLAFTKWEKHSLSAWRHTSILLYKQMHVHVRVWLLALLTNVKERQEGKEWEEKWFNIVVYSVLISCLDFCGKTVCVHVHFNISSLTSENVVFPKCQLFTNWGTDSVSFTLRFCVYPRGF